MNHAALNALIADLYAQIIQLQRELAEAKADKADPAPSSG